MRARSKRALRARCSPTSPGERAWAPTGRGRGGRRAKSVGAFAARRLVEEIASGATMDRFAADQLVPFAALVAGTSRVRIADVTEHVETAMWLAETFLGASTRADGASLVTAGRGRHAS
ncbi:MAG TPA: RNA 3'-terminal phosphate cyclase [Acidimicrobiales bacterium]|nr:RNA 3'-terminal phosphate cyclase [Acidimicrobiales bacterium]